MGMWQFSILLACPIKDSGHVSMWPGSIMLEIQQWLGIRLQGVGCTGTGGSVGLI